MNILKNFRNPWEAATEVLKTSVLDSKVLEGSVLGEYVNAKTQEKDVLSIEQATEYMNTLVSYTKDSMNFMWSQTFNEGRTMEKEIGANIYRKPDYSFFTDGPFQGNAEQLSDEYYPIESEYSGQLTLPPPTLKSDTTFVGDYHTHPITNSANLRVGFSPDMAHSFEDIYGIMYQYKHFRNHYTSIVETENQRFAIIVADPKKANRFFTFLSKSSKSDLESGFNSYVPENPTDLGMIRTGQILNFLGKNSGMFMLQTDDIGKQRFQIVGI